MKIKIIADGLYGAKGPLKIGKTFNVKDIPASWKGKVAILSGEAETVEQATKTAIKNPQFTEAELARRALLIETAKKLDKSQFTKDQLPDIKAINGILDEGVPAFTADERNKLFVELIKNQ